MNTTHATIAVDILISFPCEGGKFYSWEQDLKGERNRDFRTDLFKRQHKFQSVKENGPNRYAQCGCGGTDQGKGFFAIRSLDLEELGLTEFSIARFPKLGRDHKVTCRCNSGTIELWEAQEASTTRGTNLTQSRARGFAGLARRDPELLADREYTSANDYSGTSRTKGNRTTKESIPSLRTLGTYLLSTSGVSDWRPAYLQRRDERSFNGLIAGAVRRLETGEMANRFSRLLDGIRPIEIRPWSYFDPKVETSRSLPAGEHMIAYGFVSHLDEPTATGARLMTIRSNPEIKILMAKALVTKASNNVETPLNKNSLPFPIWAIFGVRNYAGILKVTDFAGFRVSQIGAIPITTNEEETMVGHLIRRNRVFRRLLQKVSGTNFVPDFQLLDTDLKHYVEVAGLMDDAAYAADIGKKVQHFGKDRVCVWDTRHSLRTFEAKYPEVFGYRIVQ